MGGEPVAGLVDSHGGDQQLAETGRLGHALIELVVVVAAGQQGKRRGVRGGAGAWAGADVHLRARRAGAQALGQQAREFRQLLRFFTREITPAVLSGFLNDVIKAMIFIHNHGLYRDPDPGRVKESWKLASDLFREFLTDEMVPSTGQEFFDKGLLLSGFRRWCRDKGKPEKKIPADIEDAWRKAGR